MDVLKIFILGFLFIYAVQILDLIIQITSSYASIIITKCNAKIIEISGEDKVDDANRIGFVYEPYEDEYEIDGDYIDKVNKNKKSRGKL